MGAYVGTTILGKNLAILMHKPYDSVIPFLDIHCRESLAHLLKEASKRILVSAPFVKDGDNQMSLMEELKYKLIYS